MLFDTQSPMSQYYFAPRYARGADAKVLSLLGYKPDGTQNTWGKISSWLPISGIAANLVAQNIGTSATRQNVKDDFDNRLQKQFAGLGVAQAVAGFATGNVGVGLNGVQNTIQGVSGAIGSGKSNQSLSDDYMTQYRKLNHGGMIKRKKVYGI